MKATHHRAEANELVHIWSEVMRAQQAHPVVYTSTIVDIRTVIDRMDFVKTSDLWVDRRAYQRDAEGPNGAIARQFDWRYFGAAVLCPRKEGGYFVLDAQNRTVAAAWRGQREIPAVILKAMMTDEQAKTFLGLQANRKAVNAIRTFKAAITAGDALALEVNRIVTECGFTISDGGKNTIQCVHAIYDCFRRSGETGLKDVLEIAMMHHDGNVAAMFVQGAGMCAAALHEQGERLIDYEDRLTNLGDIKTKIAAMAKETGSAKSRRVCALCIAKIIDHGRREHNGIHWRFLSRSN